MPRARPASAPIPDARTLHDVRSAATRAALVAAARPLFVAHGYDAVSAEALVASAGLTRGALYHHFDGKRGLFDAVHEALHAEVSERIVAAAEGAPDAWSALVAGCRAFLDAAAEPAFQRVALLDAPAVLGWARWRAVDAAHAAGLLREALAACVLEGALTARTPAGLDALTQLLSGAMNEAGLWIAQADDAAAARRAAGEELDRLLDGLRARTAGDGGRADRRAAAAVTRRPAAARRADDVRGQPSRATVGVRRDADVQAGPRRR